ncbi:Mdm33 family-domain-containing protein [Suillus subaureus]|uniref:Sensitive to high expression protein 9, mitochondrial n=1 Tax=Suillus subaureus TaxID=48587 RepID=A0A9P7JGX7_9AGAM|nr:Mdm33 family-domain-containing protein [Suillus subaureus]KAG1822580.1 Mdm33 family-domain-containing protein [Suillus subaureus]
MLRTRAWRPANNLRTFSHSCLRPNAQSTTSLSPGPSNVDSQAQPHRETHANVPEGVRSPPGTASAGSKVQPADSPRRLNSKISARDLDTIKQRIGDWIALATAGFKQQTDELRQRTDEFTQRTSAKFFQLGSQLNRVTGYEQIDALKQRVVEQEARIKATRQAAREAKTAYDDAVLQRSLSQRQVNELLQRKSSWTDSDVSAFTSLVRSDHHLEQHEVATKAKVSENEDALDREFGELMRAILARYHEEQVWSDKIRSASTYGSMMVLGVNVVVFILAIVVVEPWKRRRLAQTFEKKVEEIAAETQALIESGSANLDKRLVKQERLISEIVERAAYDARDLPSSLPAPIVAVSESVAGRQVSTWLEHSSIWSYPVSRMIQDREVLLIVGSAIAGGAVTLVARNLFGS